jgi:hypothetical protein
MYLFGATEENHEEPQGRTADVTTEIHNKHLLNKGSELLTYLLHGADFFLRR